MPRPRCDHRPRSFSKVVKDALTLARRSRCGRLRRSGIHRHGRAAGHDRYEDILREGDADFAWKCPTTSGTRSRSTIRRAPPGPQGRGLSSPAAPTCWGDRQRAHRQPRQALRLSLDAAMFHCNGWCFFRGRSRWWPARHVWPAPGCARPGGCTNAIADWTRCAYRLRAPPRMR